MKIILKTILFTCIFSLASIAANAQRVYVKVRPTRPPVVAKRPVAPSRAHVWVDEEWVPQGRTYVWKGNYWAAPPRPGAVYTPGHWMHDKNGNIWIAGHWR